MSRFLCCLTLISCSWGLYACHMPACESKKLVCILDRNVYGGIPAGSLYATMGYLEACMVICAQAFCEGIPVLASIHVVKNLLDIVHFKGYRDREVRLMQQLELIPESIKKAYAQNHGSEVNHALRWLANKWVISMQQLEDFKAQCTLRTTLKTKSFIYKTKNPNLQLMLILTKGQNQTPQEALRAEGFSEMEFDYIAKEDFDEFFLHIYETSTDVESIAQPIDISAFAKLFVADSALRRNVILNGHGSVGNIAQLSVEQFKQFAQVLDARGCVCLGIISCYAGSKTNREAYKDVVNFPIIAFCVGDMVSLVRISFKTRDGNKDMCFLTYFDKLDEYLRQDAPQDARACDSLFKAVEAIHVNIPQNYPWVYFPHARSPMHLSELMDTVQAKDAIKSEDRSIEGDSIERTVRKSLCLVFRLVL